MLSRVHAVLDEHAVNADKEPVGFDTGPRDPFLDDAEDPASVLEPMEASAPLTEQERLDIVADLAELTDFAAVLAPRGISGIVVDCVDCHEPHYFGWELMEANLRTLLSSGQVHTHEPACAPEINAYVSWDYARGFTDALSRG